MQLAWRNGGCSVQVDRFAKYVARDIVRRNPRFAHLTEDLAQEAALGMIRGLNTYSERVRIPLTNWLGICGKNSARNAALRMTAPVFGLPKQYRGVPVESLDGVEEVAADGCHEDVLLLRLLERLRPALLELYSLRDVEIFERYSTGDVTQAALGVAYGVHRVRVGQIVREVSQTFVRLARMELYEDIVSG